MFGFIARSLMGKLVLYFVLVAAIPLAVSGYLSFQKARSSLEEAEFSKVRLLWDAKHSALLHWFQEIADDLTFMSQTLRVRAAVETLTAAGVEPAQIQKETAGVAAILESYLKVNPVEEGFEDFLLVDAKTGKVVYSHKKLSDDKADLRSGALAGTGLAKVWDEVSKRRKPYLSDFAIYPATGTPAAFMGVPVFHTGTGELSGVLVARLNANELKELFTLGDGSGKTAEVYVVGRDMLMRCQSRFETGDTVLKKKVDTDAVRVGLEGKAVKIVSKDYRGEANISFVGPADLNKQKDFATDFDWVLISELDSDEAFEPVQALAYWVAGIAVAASLVVAAFAFLLARRIAGPVSGIAQVAMEISRGNLAVDVPQLARTDEIGALADAFRVMTANLRQQINGLLESISVLSSSASEITATLSQVATSTAETLAAVTETTATVEQVKHAARLTNEKGRGVAQASQRGVEISTAGRKATEETITRINLIKDQMESIGETVARLSEHSQAIEEIIATVQDLADQSNLLAVNASIEAARAGDQGKGFAVVAHEIKSLAEQSKAATEQVRTILDDTRKWVGSVVMATEQGTRAVQAGAEQSLVAGQSIDALSGSVAASAQAAGVIEAASDQQSIGVDQVSMAMSNIEQAMRQIADGTVQLRESAVRLGDLGTSIKDMVNHYII